MYFFFFLFLLLIFFIPLVRHFMLFCFFTWLINCFNADKLFLWRMMNGWTAVGCLWPHTGSSPKKWVLALPQYFPGFGSCCLPSSPLAHDCLIFLHLLLAGFPSMKIPIPILTHQDPQPLWKIKLIPFHLPSPTVGSPLLLTQIWVWHPKLVRRTFTHLFFFFFFSFIYLFCFFVLLAFIQAFPPVFGI